jgi:hypothetical protein
MDQNKCTLDCLRKRAKAKYAQNNLMRHMTKLDSPYKEKYDDTMMCSQTLVQNGDKLTSRYCGHRWCRICNRIRTGKLMHGYSAELEKLVDPQFLTLTIRNVKIEQLRSSIQQMTKTIRLIQDLRRKRKQPLMKCIRKIECTYNPDTNEYHPHLHIIIEHEHVAKEVLQQWIERYPEQAEFKGQDIRNAFDPIELFKYFAKLTSKSRKDEKCYKGAKLIQNEWHYPEALDLIFRAIEGLRIIQPMGGIKMVSDEIDDVEVQEIEGIENDITIWMFKRSDWYNPQTGELLTGYSPTENEFRYSHRIRYFADIQNTT